MWTMRAGKSCNKQGTEDPDRTRENRTASLTLEVTMEKSMERQVATLRHTGSILAKIQDRVDPLNHIIV